jgi:hypothetical protein
MPPKHRLLNAPYPKPAGNAFQALVDLPEHRSNCTSDGRDRQVDESDRFSARNTLQHMPSTTPAVSPPPARYTTDYGASPVRKWDKELVKKGVRTYIWGEEIDCRPDNILQYCIANVTIGAHLEWLIE